MLPAFKAPNEQLSGVVVEHRPDRTVPPAAFLIVHVAPTTVALGVVEAVTNSCEMLLVSAFRSHSKKPTCRPAPTADDEAPEAGCGAVDALSVP